MDVSIIIPTFNERENIRPLIERIRQSMDTVSTDYEIWFIDDSTDDTPDFIAQVAASETNVYWVHRTLERGLASAVVHGFACAKAPYLIVMDADLQHPPELLPVIYERLQAGSEIVIPSRFVNGGSDGGLNPLRKLISWTARIIGQVALKRLRHISDCTGGFFGLHRSVVDQVSLNPIGWKILIEVLVKGKYRTVHEIPYAFMARDAGVSKMNLFEQWNYLRHIFRLLFQSEEDRRFILFCLVGASGAVVNMIMVAIASYSFHWSEFLSSVVASMIAMINNYFWNDIITWRSVRQSGMGSFFRLSTFVGISLVSILITYFVMKLLRFAGVPIVAGQAVGIVVATFWSYTMNNRLTWKIRTKNAENNIRTQSVVVTREAKSLQ